NSVYNSGVSDRTLIEHWDGNAWVIMPSANTSPIQNNYLSGVSCTSASECWAVGYYSTGSSNQTLIEKWDGLTWSIVASPNANSAQNNQLNAVTCASASDCWAAGYANNGSSDQPLTERWNGTSWTIVASSTAATGASLNSVACNRHQTAGPSARSATSINLLSSAGT